VTIRSTTGSSTTAAVITPALDVHILANLPLYFGLQGPREAVTSGPEGIVLHSVGSSSRVAQVGV
jgi:hypothetical protein